MGKPMMFLWASNVKLNPKLSDHSKYRKKQEELKKFCGSAKPFAVLMA